MYLRSVLGAVLVAAFALACGLPAGAQPKTELHHCVPADLREDAISFTAEDGVELPGLLFGSGSSGVLLAHSMVEDVCAWLPLARQLADDGYQVLLYEARSLALKQGRYRYDLDVLAAAHELQRRGATSVVAGGGGTGGTAIASIAGRIPELKGMFLLTPFEVFMPRDVELDALAGIGSAKGARVGRRGTGRRHRAQHRWRGGHAARRPRADGGRRRAGRQAEDRAGYCQGCRADRGRGAAGRGASFRP